MYKFMSLAAVSAAWNTRKGAAFGFAAIAAKAGEQVRALRTRTAHPGALAPNPCQRRMAIAPCPHLRRGDSSRRSCPS